MTDQNAFKKIWLHLEASGQQSPDFDSFYEMLTNPNPDGQLQGVDLAGIDLSGEDLRGINLERSLLRGANLEYVDLRRANLSQSNLSGANLSGANLSEANLIGTNLSDANLAGARLNRSLMKDCNLEQSCLSNAKLVGTELSGARMRGSKLDDAKLMKAELHRVNLIDADLSRANLTGADLSNAVLTSAVLCSATLENANLSRTSLDGANLQEANLTGAELRDVHLANANLVRAKLHKANLIGSDLSKTNFRQADLSETNLRGAFLSQANLIGADLSQSKLRRANLNGADLDDANLSRADLSYSSLRSAKLVGSNLREALLVSADLRRANLEDAQIQKADLRRADLRSAKLQRANFEAADLHCADLRSAKLEEAVLQRAELSRASLVKANLSKSSCNGATFTGANLSSTIANSASFSNASMVRISLCGGDWTLADLSYANLKNADLTNTILNQANFYNVDATGANFNNAMLCQADFTSATISLVSMNGANLTDAIFREAFLNQSDLRLTILESAELKGATLEHADLRGANLINADLRDASLSMANLRNAEIKQVLVNKTNFSGAIGLDEFENQLKDQGADFEDPIVPDFSRRDVLMKLTDLEERIKHLEKYVDRLDETLNNYISIWCEPMKLNELNTLNILKSLATEMRKNYENFQERIKQYCNDLYDFEGLESKEMIQEYENVNIEILKVSHYISILQTIYLDLPHFIETQQSHEPIRNPYTIGDPVLGSNFVGREDILRQLEELWITNQNLQSIVLYGHRRMGKTSILRNASDYLGSQTQIIYINLQRLGEVKQGAAEVLLAISDEIREATGIVPPEDQAFLQLPQRTFERYLKTVLAHMANEQIATQKLIIALDEFETLETLIDQGQLAQEFLGFLRGLVQMNPNLAFAFAGLHTLEEMTADYFQPFFASVIPIRVGFLSPSATVQLLANPSEDFPLDYQPEALQKIYDLTHGQPYLCQLIGFQLVRRYNDFVFEQGRPQDSLLTVADVEAVITADFFQTGRYYFDGVWRQAAQGAPGQQAIMQMLAAHPQGLTFAELSQHLTANQQDLDSPPLTDPALEAALKTLEKHDVVAQVSEVAPASVALDRWRISVELLRIWLQRNFNLSSNP